MAERTDADLLVLVAAMVPAPGETAEEYFAATGWEEAVQRQAQRDGGMTGNADPYVVFYQDVPRDLAEEAMRRGRDQSSTPGTTPCPLKAWPAVPTRFILGTQDRFFPADFLRRVATDRLGITPDAIEAGHCVALSRPKELGDMLRSYLSG